MNMKVKIKRDGFGDLISIYLYEERGGNGEIFIAEPVELVFKKRVSGVSAKPTLGIEDYDGNFLTNLAEELDKRDIKTDKDAKIQGILEATRFHLRDLRELLKLKGGI